MRMDWIRAALQDKNAELFVAYKKNRLRRMSISNGNYVVVIQLERSRKAAAFLTAYDAGWKGGAKKRLTHTKWPPKEKGR